jgi:hypothetical protein
MAKANTRPEVIAAKLNRIGSRYQGTRLQDRTAVEMV